MMMAYFILLHGCCYFAPTENIKNILTKDYMAAVYLAGDITLLTFNELYALQVGKWLAVGKSSVLKWEYFLAFQR